MLGLIIAVMVLPLTVADDPCKTYLLLNDDGGRSSNCSLYHPNSHDRFITEGWRRVKLESTGEDLTMPMECVPRGNCGSHSNVWLNGTHPTVEEGIVDRMGCLSMFSSCCKVQYPIQIKNCTDYMVYNLKRTYGSDERYCFGDSNLCYQTTTTVRPTTASSTTKTPRSTTKMPRTTTKMPHPTTNDTSSSVFVFETDEMVTILGVCLCITLVILIALVVGIFFYWRQRRLLNKLSDVSSATTKPAYENHTDNMYDNMSISQHKVQLYETLKWKNEQNL